MKKALLEIMVDDMGGTIHWYTETLGFKISTATPGKNPVFVLLSNGDVEIMLYKREEFSQEIPKFKDIRIGGSFVLYITVGNIQTLYDSVKDNTRIIQELYTTDYGSVEFSLEDPNGYVLMFSQADWCGNGGRY